MIETPFVFDWLLLMNEEEASDLYITEGFPPTLRIENNLKKIQDAPLNAETIAQILGDILSSRQLRDFESRQELNTSLDLAKHGRFRVNVFKQRQAPGLVIRRIISKIPSFSDLGLPEIFKNLACEPRGLVLVTGMTGSGKSTTLASMLSYRNATQSGHILTVEDPIEYYHEHKKSVITQREVGVDTETYEIALKNALRQRPDVILIGEIRDRAVMEQALTISETGHLCLATLHANNAYQAIERVVNFFPEEFHTQIRLNLSMNLKAIISQRLLPSVQGKLVPAMEVLLNQALVREQIQKGDYKRMPSIMEQNTHIGMCTFDQSLLSLYERGLISEETAITQSDKSSDMLVKVRQSRFARGGLSGLDTSGMQMTE